MKLEILHFSDRKPLNLHKEYLIALILITITAISYWQVKDHNFITFDDPQYITENPQVKTGLTLESVKWAFTSLHVYNWHPVTWLSHMLDVQLFGLNPGWHHVTNLIFHIATTLLLFFVFHRMTKALWQSTLVAAIFALHPLHVESVAWVAERKDVLSAFFWMLTIGAYAYYVERPVVQRYLLTILFFILGLMAKPMLVTMPFVLLLLDYWPLGRLQLSALKLADPDKNTKPASRKHKRKKVQKNVVTETSQQHKIVQSVNPWSNLKQLAYEKIPFFILSVISCVITIIAQKDATYSIQELPLGYRITNAIVSYTHYIVKMIYPVNLSVFYPRPNEIPSWQTFGAMLVLICVTILVIQATRKFKYLAVGWFWYLGTLVPVIGLIQVGSQAMADRYTYIPLIGIFIMFAWGVHDVSRRWKNQKVILGIIAGILIIALSFGTWVQVRYWRNNDILFKHALNVDARNWKAHYILAITSSQKGYIDEAIQHYQDALRFVPYESEIHKGIGLLLAAKGNIDEAISHFEKASQIDPHDTKAREFLEINLALRGNIKEAISHYKKALQINPSNPYLHYVLGEALAKQGHFDESISHLREALRIKPDIAEAHNAMGIVLASRGKLPEAIVHFREALKLKPDYREAIGNLKIAMAQQKVRR